MSIKKSVNSLLILLLLFLALLCLYMVFRLIDQSNIFTIMEWPTPRSIHDIWSFHDLTCFYRRFIKNFNSFIAHITKCVKGHIFQWTDEAKTSFQVVKQKMIEAPVQALPNFEKLFEVNCDACEVGIDIFLSQDGHLIAFFNEKLSSSKRNYPTYDLELYVIVQTLKH